MSRICREQFIALHSLPLLKQLQQQLHDNYTTVRDEGSGSARHPFAMLTEEEKKKLKNTFNALPTPGDFDINEVLRSEYFFS